MWKVSYTIDDCEVRLFPLCFHVDASRFKPQPETFSTQVDKVMDGLKIDRSAPSKMEMTKIQLQQAKERMRATQNVGGKSEFHATQKEEDSSSSDGEVSEGED